MVLKSKVFFYFIIIQKNLDKSVYSGIIIKPHIMGSKMYLVYTPIVARLIKEIILCTQLS